MTKVYASILAADFLNLERDLLRVEIGKPDCFHFDIMDGHFVPNITFGPSLVAAARKCVSTPLNVQLLVEHPENWIDHLASAKVESVSVHFEATSWVMVHVDHIKSYGMRTGVAFNPSTPVESIEYVLPYIDFIILMTVEPGFGGQNLLPETLHKINKAKKIRDKINPKVEIGVDGGVNLKTRDSVVQAGADIIIAGTAIFKSANPKVAIDVLRGA